MATNCCSPEAVQAGPLKFFKIVFNPADHSLKIPAEFMQRFGNNLPDIIFLRVPTGSLLWKVELLRSENEIWLQNGWKEFKEHYSIGVGQVVVFEYQGNARFDVLIFDMSGSEIEYYPFDANCGEGVKDIGSQSDDSVVFLDELFTSKKGKGKGKNQEVANEKESDDSLQILDCPLASCGMQSSERVIRATEKKTCVAYQRAKCFKDDNPSSNPFAILLMQPSYVSGTIRLNIPLSMAKGNLPNKNNNLKLRSLNGKKWPVMCTLGTVNAKINSGWKKFVKDNTLKVGDACIFEVVKRKELIWNVIIFRS
ncbi:hypothetical protein Pfo_031117 [Paulownia fortunei]|nr:hypothetical protein Pfo_031117 [Paulownia fortunei]